MMPWNYKGRVCIDALDALIFEAVGLLAVDADGIRSKPADQTHELVDFIAMVPGIVVT